MNTIHSLKLLTAFALIQLSSWRISPLSNASVEVPFHATMEQQLTLTATDVPWLFVSNDRGEGQASHLGNAQLQTDGIADFSLGRSDGAIQFVGADGAELIGTYHITFAPNSDGTFQVEGDFVLTQATGRLQGWSGSGTISARVDPTEPINTAFYEGTLHK